MNKKQLLLCFGEQIRNRRIELGLSQEALAERAGLHRTYVGMIERGEKNITLYNLLKFAKALNITLGDLLQDVD